jgi:predicted dehydrogenase
MNRIGIGVAGYGYWGPNLVRNFAEASAVRVLAVSDRRRDRLEVCARRYPGIRTTTEFRDLLDDPAIEAVVIATPVNTHFALAQAALRAGKHVFVEKPMTETSEEGERLIDEAERRGLTLMVDHTFVFTPAVQKINELLSENAIGDVYYYDSVRVNLGNFQCDVNVVWDLAVHDFSILDYAFAQSPVAVSANGARHVPDSPENIAYITMYFDGGLIAHINVNWLAPVKVRKTLIGGSEKMIVFDDLEPSEKLKIYDKGVTVRDDPEGIRQVLVGYRTGDMWAPQLVTKEALYSGVEHFLRCIDTQRPPLTDGHAGLRVVGMLEAAARSMQRRGTTVEMLPLMRAS